MKVHIEKEELWPEYIPATHPKYTDFVIEMSQEEIDGWLAAREEFYRYQRLIQERYYALED